MPKQTILLIDYDPENIESTLGPLTEAGYQVEVAHDGQAGIEAFQRLQPDLVLIEPMVPKKHGFEVCQEIKSSAEGRSTPVLITTGFYRGRKHQLEAKQFYGCDEYLERPIDPETLLATCRRFLSTAAEAIDSAQAAAEPELIEDLESAIDEPREVKGTLPALDDLSEDEIMARLDALIIEEPSTVEAEPHTETPRESPVELPAETPVEMLAEPESIDVQTEDEPRPKGRRWILLAAAAAALVLIGAGAIVLGPRLTGGESGGEAEPVSSAALTTPTRQAWPSSPPASSDAGAQFQSLASGLADGAIEEAAPNESEFLSDPVAETTVAQEPAPSMEPKVRPRPSRAPEREAKAVNVTDVNAEREVRKSTPPPPAAKPRSEPRTEPEPARDPVADAPVEFAAAMLLNLPPAVESEPVPEPDPDPEPVADTRPAAAEQAPARPVVATGSLLDLDEVDAAPAPLDKRAPTYPAVARKLRLSGVVRLRVLVNERGAVDNVEVLAGNAGGLLEKSAVNGAREWTYTPATKDGVPVKVWIYEQVDFRR